MAKPSWKSEEVEEQIKQIFGVDRREIIRKDVCMSPPLGCGRENIQDEFRDALSEREYTISGLCQACQDLVFKHSIDTRGMTRFGL